MQILGNIKTANKFYIINSYNEVEWVPNLEVAKKYVSDPLCKEWYNKTIYATNEDVVIDSYGRCVLKSAIKNNDVTANVDYISMFKKQIKDYSTYILNDYCSFLGGEDILETLSWKGSSVKNRAEIANKLFSYRDTIYTFNEKCLKNLVENLESYIQENKLITAYQEYIDNFPRYKLD